LENAAVERAQTFTRRRPWYLKADIEKYFDSIDHHVLLDQIRKKVNDIRLMELIEKIVARSATILAPSGFYP